MNNAAMTFDAGTWWLIGLLVTALIGAVVFLVKRTLFSRVMIWPRRSEKSGTAP